MKLKSKPTLIDAASTSNNKPLTKA